MEADGCTVIEERITTSDGRTIIKTLAQLIAGDGLRREERGGKEAICY